MIQTCSKFFGVYQVRALPQADYMFLNIKNKQANTTSELYSIFYTKMDRSKNKRWYTIVEHIILVHMYTLMNDTIVIND